MEIAYELATEGARRVRLAVRTPPNIVLRAAAGDSVGIALSRLPPRLADGVTRVMRRLVLGDLSGYGLPLPDEGTFARLRRLGVGPSIIDREVLDAIKAERIEVAALTRRHRLPDGEVVLLGAHASVTGAMTRVELGGERLLIDCGRPRGAEAVEWELEDAAVDVDAVALTHAQLDCIGALPALVERGFGGPIYGTAPTLAIAWLMLADALALEGARVPADVSPC